MPDDLQRLEGKVDQCIDAIQKLVLIDERQVVQGQRMGAYEQRLAVFESSMKATEDRLWKVIYEHQKEAKEANLATERKLERWINYGCGAYAVGSTALLLYQVFFK